MNMEISVKHQSVIECDARQLAEIFWNMSDEEQAEFFHELHGIITTHHEDNWHSYSLGEAQWLSLANAVKKRGREAHDMFMAFSAFAYDFWPQKEAL
mgnify:CR=1 FL=1